MDYSILTMGNQKTLLCISNKNIEVINGFTEFLKTHYTDSNLRVKHMADHACLSVRCFQKKVKKMTGYTPIQLLTHYRLSQAEIALKHSNGRMMDIALNNGFSNYSTFFKSFKAHYGLGPSQYRNSYRFKRQLIQSCYSVIS